MKKNQNPWPVCLLMTAIAAAGIFCCALTHAQTPNLVVSAGSGNLANNLTVTSDSAMPWKAFTVSGGSGSGQYGVIWAESDGTVGGIYFGTIVTSSSGPVAVPGTGPAPAADLPLDALTKSAAAAVAGVDPEIVARMAQSYEALAKQVDSGTIVTPLQLQLATGTHLLAFFNGPQLESLKPLNTAVTGWLDAQQCAGHLTAAKIAGYARAYHAIATALRAQTSPAASKSGSSMPAAKVDCVHTAPFAHEYEQQPAKSPCANGNCPLPPQEPAGWFHRRR